MARSRRIAGGCSAPTEGNVPAGHARLMTAISPVDSSMIAICTMGTAPVSPHRPKSVARPAATSCATLCQTSGVTTRRGHGRWSPTRSPWMMSTRAGIVLTEQAGDVLEPGDERRRHVDAGSQNEREMGEHRYVGGFRLGAGTARLAERDAVEPQEQASQRDQDAEDEDDREQRGAGEG